MPKKTIDKKDEIKEKLDYLGIDLENVKEQINEFEDLKFRIPKFYRSEERRVGKECTSWCRSRGSPDH